MKLECNWVKADDKSRCATQREHLMLGKIKIGTVYYDGFTGKCDPKKYASMHGLPGLKSSLKARHFATKDEAKAAVKSAFDFWMNAAGLGE